MKRLEIWVVSLVILIICNMISAGYALPDYSKTKGDFKIFFIGDSKESVAKKIIYLEGIGEITCVNEDSQFTSEALGKKIICRFFYGRTLFGKERVRKIVIDFPEHQYSAGQFDIEGKEFVKYLQSMLEKIYGPPVYTSPYLFESQIKENQDKYIAKWARSTKIVGISVTLSINLIVPQIIIANPNLIKDEIQEFN